jgi:hypothetical protein
MAGLVVVLMWSVAGVRTAGAAGSVRRRLSGAAQDSAGLARLLLGAIHREVRSVWD